MLNEIVVHRSGLVRTGRIGVLGAPAAPGPCVTHVLYEPVLRQFAPMAVDVITDRVGTPALEPLVPRHGGRGGDGAVVRAVVGPVGGRLPLPQKFVGIHYRHDGVSTTVEDQ